MAKDPAFLFYYQDFLVGTEFFSHEETGAYIKILCHLADKGKLTKKQVQSICKASAITDIVLTKLKLDGDGFYFNERLAVEVEKRKNFTESRRINATKKAYAEHMEDENENKDENIIEDKKENKLFGFCRNTFINYTKESINPHYQFDGGEGRALKQLIGKLKSVLKIRKPDYIETDLIQLFSGFIQNINDDWIQNHWSLKIINSKFNEITQRRNNKKGFDPSSNDCWSGALSNTEI
jgi:uncharacterized protein YdaU (DUF1376 family)